MSKETKNLYSQSHWRESRLPPPCKWGVCSSRMLRCVS